MIISTREAFLGKRKLQDYKHESDWILITTEDKKFDDQKINKVGLERDDRGRILFNNDIYLAGLRLQTENIGRQSYWNEKRLISDYDLYYNKNKDLMVWIGTLDRSRLNINAFLDFVSSKSFDELKALSGKHVEDFANELLLK